MRRIVFLGASICAAGLAFCADSMSHVRFGADAFNCAVPPTASDTAVFSPLSFELDSVVFSDAFDPIVKAHFAESLGVLSDLYGFYGQKFEYFRTVAESNRFYFVSARAICLPDLRMASVSYRSDIQSLNAEICPASPKDGAESWLRCMLDGDMEDFDIPLGVAGFGRYAFYDLASVRFSWKEPFPVSNTRNVVFKSEDGSEREVCAMCDVRMADLWQNNRFSMIRLPLADGAWLFAMVPNGGLSLADIRPEISAERIDTVLMIMNSVTAIGVSHGPVAVVLPKMDISVEVDLSGAFSNFRFPLKGFARMDDEMRPAAVKQRVRFRLDEQGLDPEPLKEKPENEVVHVDADTKRFILNRPFLFFVYHGPTGTIPVAGQFTGRQ